MPDLDNENSTQVGNVPSNADPANVDPVQNATMQLQSSPDTQNDISDETQDEGYESDEESSLGASPPSPTPSPQNTAKTGDDDETKGDWADITMASFNKLAGEDDSENEDSGPSLGSSDDDEEESGLEASPPSASPSSNSFNMAANDSDLDSADTMASSVNPSSGGANVNDIAKVVEENPELLLV